MGEAVAEVVGVAAGEDLRFGFQAPECAGVNDAVAVALVLVSVGMRRLGKAASTGLFDVHRVGGEHGESLAEQYSVLGTQKSRTYRGELVLSQLRVLSC